MKTEHGAPYGLLRADRSVVQRFLWHRGYDVVGRWRSGRRPQAAFLRRLFTAARIDTVFDIGANRGQYRDFLRQEVRFTGGIVSVEPVPELALHLRTRAKSDDRWLILECAVSDRAGTATFNVTRNTEFASLLQPKGAKPELFHGMDDTVRQVVVEVMTLDDVIRRARSAMAIGHPYLKLDTQGHDGHVIAGAGTAMEEFVALQTEVSITPLYEGAPGLTESLSQLAAIGFVPSAIFPNNEGHFPELLEFDCHLVRQPAVLQLRAADACHDRDE